jgi:hypothetical protein
MDSLNIDRPIYPFRWNIQERSQLGKLLEAAARPGEDEKDPFRDNLLRTWYGGVEAALTRFMEALIACSARAIGLCGNSELFFVGRSPESMYDFLSGLLFDTEWSERLTQLHFSTGFWRWGESDLMDNLSEIKGYFAYVGLDPVALAARERPVAFVDIVASGDTFGALAYLLRSWCREVGADWPAVRRKLRVVALAERNKPSPKAHRWFQHVDWLDLYERGAIKSASISSGLFHYLGGSQPKASQSHQPYRWGKEELLVPRYDRDTLAGLRMAVTLFDAGREVVWRDMLTHELCRQPAMQHGWFRDLVIQLRKRA